MGSKLWWLTDYHIFVLVLPVLTVPYWMIIWNTTNHKYLCIVYIHFTNIININSGNYSIAGFMCKAALPFFHCILIKGEAALFLKKGSILGIHSQNPPHSLDFVTWFFHHLTAIMSSAAKEGNGTHCASFEFLCNDCKGWQEWLLVLVVLLWTQTLDFCIKCW